MIIVSDGLVKTICKTIINMLINSKHAKILH